MASFPPSSINSAFSLLNISLLDGEFGRKVQLEELCFLAIIVNKIQFTPIRLFFFLFWGEDFFFFSERQRGGGRERNINLLFHSFICIHWLVFACALTGDRTLGLGESGRHPEQLNRLPRAPLFPLELSAR